MACGQMPQGGLVSGYSAKAGPNSAVLELIILGLALVLPPRAHVRLVWLLCPSDVGKLVWASWLPIFLAGGVFGGNPNPVFLFVFQVCV